MRVWTTVWLVLFVALAACTSVQPGKAARDSQPSRDESASAIASRFGFKITGEAGERTTWTVPGSPDDFGPFWNHVQTACVVDGYDLRPYAGERVSIQWYVVRGDYDGHAMRLAVCEHDGATVGAWVDVPDLLDGTVSLSEARRLSTGR